jgi:hypothetical protein
MIRAPTDPAARAATTSRRLDARLDDAQIIAHAKSSNAAPLDANTRKFPLGFPFGFSRLGFRAYPITPRPRRDRRFARVHVARAPLSRVAIDAMKIIEAIDRDRVGDARADAREHDDDRPSGRRMRRDRTRRAIASKHVVNYTYLLPCGRQIIMDLALATLPVVTATVFATCAEAWVMADMISRYACDYVARPRAARAPGGCEGVRIRIRDVLYMGSSLYYKLCKLYVRK